MVISTRKLFEGKMFLYMLQGSELVNLVMGFISVLIFFLVFNKPKRRGFNFIYFGFFSIILAYIFTVVEGIIWNNLFNFLEHLSYALAGLFFAIGSWTIYKQSELKEYGPGEK